MTFISPNRSAKAISQAYAKTTKGKTELAAETHPFNPKYTGAGGSKFVQPKGGKVKGYKKGGKVKKTGLAKLHKGERVLNKKQTKKFDKSKFNKTRMSFAKGN